MAFAISADLEELIRRKVASGNYDSALQVIQEALLLLDERDSIREIRKQRLLIDLAAGISEAENRHLVPAAEVFKGMVARASASEE